MEPVPLPARPGRRPPYTPSLRPIGRWFAALVCSAAAIAPSSCGDPARPVFDDPSPDPTPADVSWDADPGSDSTPFEDIGPSPPDGSTDADAARDSDAPDGSDPDADWIWGAPIQGWPGALLSVHGSGPDDVWVVGASDGHGGTLLHWNGSAWTRHTDVSDRGFWWVEAVTANDVWVGGEEGVLRRWDGTQFHPTSPPTLARHTIFGLTSTPDGTLHVVGGQGGRGGFLWQGDGSAWHPVELPDDRPRFPHGDTAGLFKIAADDESLWLVGGSGQALRGPWEGPFARIPIDGEEPLFTVAVSPDRQRVLAVGGAGVASIHSLRPAAPVVHIPSVPLLQGVAFGPDGTAWAAGARGTIWNDATGEWAEVHHNLDLPIESLHAIWVDPAGHVWAVGGNVLGASLTEGVLLHGRPASAAPVATPALPPAQPETTGCPAPVPSLETGSIARIWNELTLAAIRRAFPEPTVHARNLYHVSLALHDAWASARDDVDGLVLDVALPNPTDAAQAEAMSYAAHRLLNHRYAHRHGGTLSAACFDAALDALGFAADDDAPRSEAARVGQQIGDAIIAAFALDGSLEHLDYRDATWRASNPSLVLDDPGIDIDDPDLWQPLDLAIAVTQNGIPEAAGPQQYIGPHWGAVVPFAMHRAVADAPALDSGPGPLVADTEMGAWVLDVLRHTAWLDIDDGVLIDISPAARGNAPLGTAPGTGHAVNPITGAPYEPQRVLRGDFGRVLAEHWADGPNSETPPGHWNVLAHRAFDHPDFIPRWRGEGPPLDRLQWDVRAFLVLNGALHDAAIVAWGVKRTWEGARPISLVRWMAAQGQRSEPDAPDYHPLGLPLEDGLVERITVASSRPGERHAGLRAHVGELAVWSWPGEPSDRATRRSPFVWMRAAEWIPYQPRTFVTPAFPGFVSGHSTFSRAAADVLTALTGTPFVPGGLHEYIAPARHGLHFEAGPSFEVRLQWATWQDAADQAGESRIWGGIHVAPDDFMGRRLGAAVAYRAIAWADARFGPDGPRPGVPTAADPDGPPEDPIDPADPALPYVPGTAHTGDPTLLPGTGRDAVDPLRNGDWLVWESGVQGGHHVWVTARLDTARLADRTDAERNDVRTHFTLTRTNGELLGEIRRVGGYRHDGEGWAQWGNFMILRPGLRPRRLDDEPLRLQVSVTLPDGVSLQSTVWVVSQCCDLDRP